MVLALALANGFFADAQNNNVPGPTAYSQFSGFISQRNIFDPSRYPRTRIRDTSASGRRRAVRAGTPAFTLVGTMSYEKGMFAFFDGNNSELRKVLYQSDSNGIAGYTVMEITPNSVKLQAPDKKETVQLKIGEMIRQEGGSWQPVGRAELPAGDSSRESTAPAADNPAASPATDSAPSAAIEGNDILKKLMQQREQELK